MDSKFVVVSCQDELLAGKPSEVAIYSQMEDALRRFFPGRPELVRDLQASTYRVVSAPYRFTLEIAQLFLHTAKELMMDYNAQGLTTPMRGEEVEQWLKDIRFSGRVMPYNDCKLLHYNFNHPQDKIIVAVVPTSFLAKVEKEGGAPSHHTCKITSEEKKSEGKIYIGIKNRFMGKSRYACDVEAARLQVAIIKQLRPLVRESPPPDNFGDAVTECISRELRGLSAPVAIPESIGAQPTQSDFSLGELKDEMQAYSASNQELLSALRDMQSALRRP